MSLTKNITDFFKRFSFFHRTNEKEKMKVLMTDLECRLFALEELVIKQSYVISTFFKVQDEIFTFLLGDPGPSAGVKNTSLKSQKIFAFNQNDDDDLIN